MLTEVEARALLLEHASRPDLLARELLDPSLQQDAALLERWIACQDWLETPRGWLVDGDLQGYRFHVDRVPRSRALYVVAGHLRHPGWQTGWWVELLGRNLVGLGRPIQQAS